MNYEDKLSDFIAMATIAEFKTFRKALKTLTNAGVYRSNAIDTLVSAYMARKTEKANRSYAPVVVASSKY